MESRQTCRPRHISLREDLKWALRSGAGSLLAVVVVSRGDWGRHWGVLVGSALVLVLCVLTGIVKRHRGTDGRGRRSPLPARLSRGAPRGPVSA